MRILGRSLLFAAVCSAGAACSSAYADQVAIPQAPGPRIALAVAPDKTRAPYDVQIVTEDGDNAPTYAFKGRYYVQGNADQRYIIRVTNPTPRRVEAVVSVDGLDVVDGEAGDLRKRGYIVPAYGQVNIEGFRTSLADVATFRFSSVDDSYAGRKGKARNVGVIAVAIFEEQAPPPDVEIVAPQPTVRYHWDDDADRDFGDAEDAGPAPRTATSAPSGGRHVAAKKDSAKAADRVSSAEESQSRAAPAEPGAVGGAAPMRPRPPMNDEGGEYEPPPPATQAPRTYRPGLGTEFGESRYSAASYTKFVRAANRPIAIAELRYNDAAGLMALGIPVAPMPDEGEIMTRETADPFPGDHQFARAPR